MNEQSPALADRSKPSPPRGHYDLLREAVRTGNIALALAISRTLEAHQRFIQEASQTIISTLESAPSEE